MPTRMISLDSLPDARIYFDGDYIKVDVGTRTTLCLTLADFLSSLGVTYGDIRQVVRDMEDRLP